ncbi:hypothetical protein BLNAU_15239 [Blattamonas nauphoetae]|uniref:Uncharacterized protein n=1 Tax=Blattamonas nauphoetae TaxID=2049346 RepID=A0ABQ9XEK8_9EUKA|nr:hypothetical protein BLNAU_15239 [Blattamonas nauphoetae]
MAVLDPCSLATHALPLPSASPLTTLCVVRAGGCHCSPFLNWTEDHVSEVPKGVVFQSLIATVKSQPALDVSLEAKAVKFLEYMHPKPLSTVHEVLGRLTSYSDDPLPVFVQRVVVLISSPNLVITAASMKLLRNLIELCSAELRLPLVQADLIPQLIVTLNPQSLSFAETADIHTYLLSNINGLVSLATPDDLAELGIQDENEQQAIHETIVKQVLLPSEQYIRHLCVNRTSIIDGDQSNEFMTILAQLLDISPYYPPTMEIVIHMPIFLAIPSCLTSFENDESNWSFLYDMSNSKQEWNKERGEVRQMWKTVHRMLRMEGIEDVIEGTLRNDKNEYFGSLIVDESIGWNNLLGMNLPKQE